MRRRRLLLIPHHHVHDSSLLFFDSFFDPSIDSPQEFLSHTKLFFSLFDTLDDGDLVSGNGSGSGGGDDDDDECPDDEEGCNSGNRPRVYSPPEPVDKDTDTNQGNNVNSFISTSSSTANPLYPDVKSISTRAPVVVLVPEGKSSSASWMHRNLAVLILTFFVVQSISLSALSCHFNG